LRLLCALALLADPFAAITAPVVRKTSGRRDSCRMNPWGISCGYRRVD
jgi:hypothetical protein